MAAELVSFPTEDGRCDVYPDRLELTRTGPVVSGPVRRIAAVVVTCAGFCFLVFNTWQRQLYGFTIFFGLLALVVLLAQVAPLLITALTVSTAPVIARAAIVRLAYRPARPGETRANFVVLFRQGKRLRSRFILLSDPLGDEAAAQALAALHTLGLPVEQAQPPQPAQPNE